MKKFLRIWSLSLFVVCSANAQRNLDVLDGCGMEGSSKIASVKKLNRLKNRYTVPQDSQINRSITLRAMLAPGDDKLRWNSNDAMEITGYVLDIKPGGSETCNCAKKDPAHKDAHIELVLHSTDTLLTQSVVVEVTPRFQLLNGPSWSEKNLRKRFLHKWIKVRAWMMLDAEHTNAAENTHPGGKNNWRATAWEGHPVSSIEIAAVVQR
jgi:hypothetical protein